ncbi:MAG: 50S ribosomal protein L13 [Patescibacteria group bacterium]
MSKTYQPKQKEVKRDWHLIDAKGQVLGRLATKVAILLMGKQKATYSTHMDSGDNVVVVNAELINVTGNKAAQKVYQSHSGYPGGFKEVSFEKMSKLHPARIIEFAVKGMLPDNRLQSDRMARLHVTKGLKHKYVNNF